jgi:hypothetical protein
MHILQPHLVRVISPLAFRLLLAPFGNKRNVTTLTFCCSVELGKVGMLFYILNNYFGRVSLFTYGWHTDMSLPHCLERILTWLRDEAKAVSWSQNESQILIIYTIKNIYFQQFRIPSIALQPLWLITRNNLLRTLRLDSQRPKTKSRMKKRRRKNLPSLLLSKPRYDDQWFLFLVWTFNLTFAALACCRRCSSW